MKAKILNGNGYKDRVFEGVVFPVIVEVKIAKTGIERGFALVTYGAMSEHGLTVPKSMEGFEHDYDHGFMFSPDQFELI